MAGLNFQTQTIINSNLDPDSGEGVVLFETVEKANNYSGGTCAALQVKRDFLFLKDNVDCIRKKAGYEAELCEATIDFTQLESTLVPTDHKVNYCRLDIYVGIEGAAPYIYSNPWYHKGKPFWVEFIVKKGDKAADIADRVEKTIKSNHIFQVDKDLIKITNEKGKLTLTGATEYQRFKKIEILMFEDTDDYADVVAALDPDPTKISSGAAIDLTTLGANAFGTYSQIIKDLRLPTAANYQWLATHKVEVPIVGAIYDEYIIEYHAPANSHPLSVVGGHLDSHTTHVFWVKNDKDLIDAWDQALETLGTITKVTEDNTTDSHSADAPVTASDSSSDSSDSLYD